MIVELLLAAENHDDGSSLSQEADASRDLCKECLTMISGGGN
jgi:hypothetical protein